MSQPITCVLPIVTVTCVAPQTCESLEEERLRSVRETLLLYASVLAAVIPQMQQVILQQSDLSSILIGSQPREYRRMDDIHAIRYHGPRAWMFCTREAARRGPVQIASILS